MLKVGQALFFKDRKYVVVIPNLGRGSFGITALLKDEFIDEFFAVKKYIPEFVELKEDFYSSFLQEIKILYKLNHPNVVRIFNYHAYPEAYTGYIFMEYIEGENIAEYFNNAREREVQVSPDDIFSQLISGFHYLEKAKIFHRDIREGNILITSSGEVKIIDFGLGKISKPISKEKDSKNQDINRNGLDVLPQEHWDGMYNSRTDMFYLGELINRLIRRSKLYYKFSYNNIVKKMMSIDPEGRFSSFEEISNIIAKKDFELLGISEEDKIIYQKFSSELKYVLNHFIDKRDFVEKADDFLKKIDHLLLVNCFEEEIQDNLLLMQTVLTGGYNYKTSACVSVDTVKEFRDWFITLIPKNRQLVLDNIISKLSSKPIKESDDIPF